jgi:hypothetical protein
LFRHSSLFFGRLSGQNRGEKQKNVSAYRQKRKIGRIHGSADRQKCKTGRIHGSADRQKCKTERIHGSADRQKRKIGRIHGSADRQRPKTEYSRISACPKHVQGTFSSGKIFPHRFPADHGGFAGKPPMITTQFARRTDDAVAGYQE